MALKPSYDKGLLQRLYTDPTSPAGYTGADSLLKEAKLYDKTITKKDVIHFLEGQRTYTLFKQRKLKFLKSRTIPSGYMTDLQADLAGIYQ